MIRIVSATNKNLQEAIEGGKFREDLYHRLNVIPVHVTSTTGKERGYSCSGRGLFGSVWPAVI